MKEKERRDRGGETLTFHLHASSKWILRSQC
jgi:hypothetical protein